MCGTKSTDLSFLPDGGAMLTTKAVGRPINREFEQKLAAFLMDFRTQAPRDFVGISWEFIPVEGLHPNRFPSPRQMAFGNKQGSLVREAF